MVCSIASARSSTINQVVCSNPKRATVESTYLQLSDSVHGLGSVSLYSLFTNYLPNRKTIRLFSSYNYARQIQNLQILFLLDIQLIVHFKSHWLYNNLLKLLKTCYKSASVWSMWAQWLGNSSRIIGLILTSGNCMYLFQVLSVYMWLCFTVLCVNKHVIVCAWCPVMNLCALDILLALKTFVWL